MARGGGGKEARWEVEVGRDESSRSRKQTGYSARRSAGLLGNGPERVGRLAWLEPRTPYTRAGRGMGESASRRLHPSPGCTRGAHRSPRLPAGKSLNWVHRQAGEKDLVPVGQERVCGPRKLRWLGAQRHSHPQPPTDSPGSHPSLQGPGLPARSPHRLALKGSGGVCRSSENFAKDGNSRS